MDKSPRRLVERFYADVWGKGDEAAAREIMIPEVRYTPSLGPAQAGIASFLDYMRSIRAALADFTGAIEDMVEGSNRVAARVRFSGVHRGPFLGVAATGRTVAWTGGAFFTVEGSRITRIWMFGDLDSVKQQLNAASKPNLEPEVARFPTMNLK